MKNNCSFFSLVLGAKKLVQCSFDNLIVILEFLSIQKIF